MNNDKVRKLDLRVIVAIIIVIIVLLSGILAFVPLAQQNDEMIRNSCTNITQFYGIRYANTSSVYKTGPNGGELEKGYGLFDEKHLNSTAITGSSEYFLNSTVIVSECQPMKDSKMLESPRYVFCIDIEGKTNFGGKVNYDIKSQSNFTSLSNSPYCKTNQENTFSGPFAINNTNSWKFSSTSCICINRPSNSIGFQIVVSTVHGLKNTYDVIYKKATFEITYADGGPCSDCIGPEGQHHPFLPFSQVYFQNEKNHRISEITQDCNSKLWYFPLKSGINYEVLQIKNDSLRSLLYLPSTLFKSTLPVFIQLIYNYTSENISARISTNPSYVT